VPIFYFTELMGLAFGLPDARNWWGKHLINTTPVLSAAGLA
jgi:heterodisulfide reductase subunit B